MHRLGGTLDHEAATLNFVWKFSRREVVASSAFEKDYHFQEPQ
jgi:hypothetical protein